MNERITNILKHRLTVPVSIGVASFGGGLGLGYFLGKRRASVTIIPAETYDDEGQIEFDFDTEGLAEERKQARMIIDEEAYLAKPTLAPESDALVEGDAVIVQSTETDEAVEDEEQELVQVNVFENPDTDWDWEKEVESRTPEKPYVLHKDEFYRDELSFTQTTLTYFMADELMVDEDQTLVSNWQAITGPLLWGHGSGDSNVVYVRNEERRGEYEILRDTGSYAEEILGLEAEEKAEARDLKHSRNHKFRDD